MTVLTGVRYVAALLDRSEPLKSARTGNSSLPGLRLSGGKDRERM
jgi:hypothetical protein